MIPEREILEQVRAGTGPQQRDGYTRDELDQIDTLRPHLAKMTPAEQRQAGREIIKTMWPDLLTRIAKTHLIKTKKVGEVVLFQPNDAQKRFYQDVVAKSVRQAKPIRCVILKARQLGFSTFLQSLYAEWLEEQSARSALTVSYSRESTTELFQKTIFVRRNKWFSTTARRDSRNVLELDNDSTFFVKTAGTDSVGRGDTFHYLHCSEIPMWPDADEAFTSVMQSVPDQEGTCVVLESTARGAVGPFYNEWRKAERGESDFIPFFAPWFWDPEYCRDLPVGQFRKQLEQSLDLEERRLIERHQLTLEQLHWRRWAIANKCQGSVNKFKQEYPASPEEAFLSTGSPCFDAFRVASLADNARPPLWQGEVSLLRPRNDAETPEPDLQQGPAGRLRIWDPPAESREYVIGADVAEGRVRDKTLSARRKLYSYSDGHPDYSAAAVIELETGLHVASWRGHCNPFDFATILYAMGLHYNSALMVVEINGPGIGTITCLSETLGYPNLYRSRQYAVMEGMQMSTQFGWRTLPQTREQLMFRITEALAENQLFTRDGPTVDEMRTMERDPNGNPRALGNNKDDRVFALALALQGRYDVFGGRQSRPGPVQVKNGADRAIWGLIQSREERQADARTRSGGRMLPGRHVPRGRLPLL